MLRLRVRHPGRMSPSASSASAGSSGSSGSSGPSGSSGSSAAGRGSADYSGTPLARKIGVKPGHAVHLHHAPPGWTVPDVPPTAVVTEGDPGGADVTVAFYRDLATLAAEAMALVTALADPAMLWIAWPRRATGHTSDITDNGLRELFLPLGVVDTKVAALDDAWSGLKFVRRVANRGGTS